MNKYRPESQIEAESTPSELCGIVKREVFDIIIRSFAHILQVKQKGFKVPKDSYE